jgi:RHS repeat-associated protein
VSGTPTVVQAATFRLNHRFPGQIFEAESGKSHNYFRDYDPSIGRYVESDPIGLKGSLDTYGYVGANPNSGRDLYGLKSYPLPKSKAGVRACAQQAALNVWIASQSWSFGTPNKDKTPWNAMLHCVGSCEIGNRCGLGVSFAAGFYHEIYDDSRPGRIPKPGEPPLTLFPFWDDPRDSYNDVNNNLSGLDCSRNGCNRSTASCYQCCWLKLLGGRLEY